MDPFNTLPYIYFRIRRIAPAVLDLVMATLTSVA